MLRFRRHRRHPLPITRRTALVFSAGRQGPDALLSTLAAVGWLTVQRTEEGAEVRGPGLALRLELAQSASEALERLGHAYYSLVLVDCRRLDARSNGSLDARVNEFLETLRREPDRERRYPPSRIVALVGASDAERVDRQIFQMGERHLGGCLRDRSVGRDDDGGESRERFVAELWETCRRITSRRRRGAKALNLAGGGISGLFYELGVLKCLDDCFSGGIRAFDLLYGISAGAVVAAGIANRMSVDELLAKLGRLDESWPYRLQLGWRHLNLAEVPRRLLLAQRELLAYLGRIARREDEWSLPAVLGTSSVLLGTLFDSDEFEQVLRSLLTREGRTNDFRELEPRLFIGATDQDRREHVLFGAAGTEHVPISKAIQASTAMHPFFPSVEIDGRFYTDGIVTRTCNLRAAIDEGADLVFVVDPFVPLVTGLPGFQRGKDSLWLMEQDYRTLSYTRYEQVRNELMRRNPQVTIYTFVPSRRTRHLIANQNPFVSRNFNAIVVEAYLSTLRRIRQIEHRLAGDLATHGIGLDCSLAEERAARIRAARRPKVALLLDGETRRFGAARRSGAA